MAVTLGTVAPIGFDDFADPQWLEMMAQLGCTSIQIYRNRHGNDSAHSGPVTTEQMLAAVANAPLPVDSLHGLYGNDIDPSCPAEDLRKQAVEVFRSEGELALLLGGPLVVVHCAGIVPESFTPADRPRRRAQLRKSIAELAGIGEQLGVRYAFENLPPYHALGFDVAELAALLQDVNHPNAGMCFDVAHAHLAGNCYQAARQAANHAIYVHVCDNNGKKDDHLMPGDGNIDWDAYGRIVRETEYDGVLMLETFYRTDKLRQAIDQGLADRLQRFLAIARGDDPSDTQ